MVMTPEKSETIRKKFALLLLMLHMWESTSSMYSTTSFLRDGSARPSLAATMIIAWNRKLSTWLTVKGWR